MITAQMITEIEQALACHDDGMPCEQVLEDIKAICEEGRDEYVDEGLAESA